LDNCKPFFLDKFSAALTIDFADPASTAAVAIEAPDILRISS